MRIDIVNIRRFQTGIIQSITHGPEAAIAVLCRGGDMMGIAGHSITCYFGIDGGPPGPGAFVFFQNDNAGPLTHDEAVSIPVIGPGSLFRCIVEARRHGAGGHKAGHTQTADRGFRPAGDHHVSITVFDHPGGISDGMGPG